MKTKVFFIIPIFFALSLETEAVNPTRGILNQKAPSWEISSWFQLPDDKKFLDVADFKDKVIYLYCFQSWCPGCHKYGFPTLKEVIKQYENDKDVAIVAVQTTFEGFSYNGIEQAKEVAKKYRLKIPIGQSGSRDHKSKLIASYRTGGTPWTIIIDKQGIVRYNNFHIDSEYAVKLLEHLKGKS